MDQWNVYMIDAIMKAVWCPSDVVSNKWLRNVSIVTMGSIRSLHEVDLRIKEMFFYYIAVKEHMINFLFE